MHRLDLNGSRHVALDVIVSALALTVEKPFQSVSDFAKYGTSPQRISTISLSVESFSTRMTGSNVEGATLKFGA
jgi:hypothetical protein